MTCTSQMVCSGLKNFCERRFHSGSNGNMNNQSSDGKISSTVMLTTLLSVILVVIGLYAGNQTTKDTVHFMIWGLIMGLVLVGLITNIIIAVSAHKNRDHWLDPVFTDNDPSLKMKVFFLWMFGFGMVLQTTINGAIHIECLTKKSHIGIQSLSIISSFLMAAFLCLQMGFITYYKTFRFISSVRTNYCLIFVALANLALWFNSVISDINGIYYPSNNTIFDNTSTFINDRNCYWRSPIQQFYINILPYLIPVRMEFCLLATSFLFKMIPSKGGNNGNTELEPLLVAGRTDWYGEEDLGNSTQMNYSVWQSIVYILVGVLAVFINLPLFIITLLFHFVYTGDLSVTFSIYEGTLFVHRVILLMLLLLSFYLLSRNSESRRRIHEFCVGDYLLIISSFCTIAYNTVSFVSSLKETCSSPKLVSAKNIISMIDTFLLTVLIIQSKSRSNVQNRSKLLSSIYLILTISSLTLWLADTVVGLGDNISTEGQEQLLGYNVWKVSSHILFSMIIFYRFYSGSDCYGLFRAYR